MSVHAADAPQPWDGFRGHNHDGIYNQPLEKPSAWPAKLRVVWSTGVGNGYSSPITDGTNIYLQERKGDDEFLTAFNAADGRQLWKSKLASQKEPSEHEPACTPLCDNGSLYVHSLTGSVLKLNASDGTILWTRNLPAEWPGEKPARFGPFYGTACSPVLFEKRIALQIGVKDSGKAILLNTENGKTEFDAPLSAPAYGSCLPIPCGNDLYLGTLGLQEFNLDVVFKRQIRSRCKV